MADDTYYMKQALMEAVKAAEQGRVLTLECNGKDEDEMIADLVDLIEVKKFNEE